MKSITKPVLYALIASVAISGLFGIMAILGGGGDLQMRILGTTSTISAASLCSLICAASWERKRKKVLPLSGIALTLLGALLLIVAIWANSQNDPYVKFMLCVITFAIATTHLSLLSLANLSESFRWSLGAAYLAVYGLASLISFMVVEEDPGETTVKIAAILSIAVASISILIPIFHRLSAGAVSRERLQAEGNVMCPCCGSIQPRTTGEITCPKCGSVFEIRVVGSVRRS